MTIVFGYWNKAFGRYDDFFDSLSFFIIYLFIYFQNGEDMEMD